MSKRKIDTAIVHCSDSPQGRGDDVNTLRRWHVEGNGWSDIGYHYVILEDGTIQVGRDINTAGAHAYGYNSNSIGICLIGKDEFTKMQFLSLEVLLKGLKNQYEIEDENIYGHYKVSSKTCPNFDVEAFKKSLK